MRKLRLALAALVFAFSLPSFAAGHGGGGGAASAGLSFVTNLAGPGDHYLRLDIALETGNPEVDLEIKTLMPRIQHEIILLLSGLTDGSLRKLEGKLELADRLRQAVNRVIRESEKTGVKEVLFTNFIIQ